MTTHTLGFAFGLLLLTPAVASGQADADSNRTVGISYQYEHLTDGFDPWQMITLDASDRVGTSTIIARLHLARRFARGGAQAELEAYPRIGKRTYLYLNVARRVGSDVFIRTRAAAEAYHNFPHGWEGSVGGRYFDRESQRDLFGLTGTVAKYVGNYWLSLRPTVVFREEGTSRSIAATGRKYFADRYNYVGVRASAGSAPDATRDDRVRLEETGLRSYSVDVERANTIRADRYRLKYGLGFDHDAYRRDAAGKAVVRRHFMMKAGIEIPLR